MMHNVRSQGRGSCVTVNYRKSGQPFLNHMRIECVVSTDIFGQHFISHYFGVLQELPWPQANSGQSSPTSSLGSLSSKSRDGVDGVRSDKNDMSEEMGGDLLGLRCLL